MCRWGSFLNLYNFDSIHCCFYFLLGMLRRAPWHAVISSLLAKLIYNFEPYFDASFSK